jgi:uncharacterized protein (TIGR02145 family)
MPIIMKKVLAALFAVALGLNLSAQTDYVETWDPDADGDGLIGVSDLLALLGVFQEEDMDNDGIWDSQDDCVGAYDECEVCNGPGPQILGIDTIIVYYDSLYAEAIDEWWVYELYSDTLLTYLCENPGCIDPTADNYDPYAIEEDGSCVYSNGSPVCGFESAIYFDGYTYDLVAIGDQCWFAENLRTEHYANGDEIPGDLSNGDWQNANVGAQSVYDNDPVNLVDYGRLYNWYAVEDERGLCPSGWHVVADEEWLELELTMGMDESEAYSTTCRAPELGITLMASSLDDPPWSGSNSTGFSGLPNGYRNTNGEFSHLGTNAFLWTSSQYGFSNVWSRTLGCMEFHIGRHNYNEKAFGAGVRCLKGSE